MRLCTSGLLTQSRIFVLLDEGFDALRHLAERGCQPGGIEEGK
jgi:hypothetical protein